MTRTHTLGIPAIAALLAQLASGCGSYDTLDGSGGTNYCGGDETTTRRITELQIEMLEANPDACISLCDGFGLYADTCSWSRDLSCDDTTVGPGDSSSGSASTGDASTDEGTSTGGDTSGGASTGDASTGEAASTGDASTGGGASTGDPSTGEAASTGDPSTGDATTSAGASTGAASDAGTSGAPGGDGCGGELECTMFSACEVGGRGHAALQPAARARASDALGEWLAAMAHSEAASVVAFQAIANELAAHGAPDELVRRAREAADDEVRHAEVMGALARHRGVEPARPCFGAIEVRELEALARENAVEGCVRETWAALAACCQARRAMDSALRRVMAGIAADESRHAQLSWDLDAWARTRLSPEAVARIDAARAEAVELLERSVAAALPAPLHASAGIPEPAVARELLAELRAVLWS